MEAVARPGPVPRVVGRASRRSRPARPATTRCGRPAIPTSRCDRAASRARRGRVTISCLVSDLVFRWQLRESGDATDIDVEVDLPDREAHRLPEQRRLLVNSLQSLAALAEHNG